MKRNKRYIRIGSLIMSLILMFQITGIGEILAFAEEKRYESGSRVYVGDLHQGDFLEEGVTLYPDFSSRFRVHKAEMTIDDEEFIMDEDAPEYTTDRALRVTNIQWNVYTKAIRYYRFETVDQGEREQMVSVKDTHIYVGDMAIGDVVCAGSHLHSKGQWFETYDHFRIFLDGSSEMINESYYEWSPTTPARLVSTGIPANDNSGLDLYFETFYFEGEVGSELSLQAALNKEETIVVANNIDLDGCFFINDGKEHTLDLNGYTLSRVMTGKEATGHVIQVNKGSKLTIKDSSEDNSGIISGGLAPNGGGIYVEGELVIEGGSVAKNTADNGGGIFIRGGNVTISGSAVIEENSAGNGGGIYVTDGGTVTMDGGKLENNKCTGSGGGIYNNSTLNMKDSSVISNAANNAGAGIWSSGTASLKNVQITQNTNASSGSGIYNNGRMTVDSCIVTGNSSGGTGGGIMLDTGSAAVFTGENRIGENYAQYGGGIYSKQSSLELNNAVIGKNITSGTGGGIYFDGSGTLSLKKISITENINGIYMNNGSIVLAGGTTVVNGNMGNAGNSNIVFGRFQKILVTGKLNLGSSIGITAPNDSDSIDLTDSFGKYNDANTDDMFFSDTQSYRVKADKNIPEVRFVTRLLPTADGYTIKITVKVTDDADHWDYAYLKVNTRTCHGRGYEREHASSPNFCESIDHADGYYEYQVNCGTAFPSSVTFMTMYGLAGTWRDFEADVKVYINGVNCGSTHYVHDVYGVESKSTRIKIGGDKYPYPDIDIDQKSEIETDDENSHYVTINAVDQYGVSWTTEGESNEKTYWMENLSFPDTPDTDKFTDVDGNGLKWKMTTNMERDHYSDYKLTFRSGSNVYPEITTKIRVHFVFPLYLTIVIDNETVLKTSGRPNQKLQIEQYPCKEGYYIKNFKSNGACYLSVNEDGVTYTFGFGKEDIVLTADLKGIAYKIAFEKNGDPLKNGEDVRYIMNQKPATYDKATPLPTNYYERPGYIFKGWNTEPDGSGTAYADKEKVKNLTSIAGAVVKLYAQWEPDPAVTTTASIFAQGTLAIWIGGGVMVLSLIAAAIYMRNRKRAEQF